MKAGVKEEVVTVTSHGASSYDGHRNIPVLIAQDFSHSPDCILCVTSLTKRAF